MLCRYVAYQNVRNKILVLCNLETMPYSLDDYLVIHYMNRFKDRLFNCNQTHTP